jgi:hypothetical protein
MQEEQVRCFENVARVPDVTRFDQRVQVDRVGREDVGYASTVTITPQRVESRVVRLSSFRRCRSGNLRAEDIQRGSTCGVRERVTSGVI